MNSPTLPIALVVVLFSTFARAIPAHAGPTLPEPTYFGSRLPQLLDQWPPRTLALPDGGRTAILRAIKTPDNEDMIGLVKHFELHAPLQRVVELSERYEDYPQMWEEVLQVRVESRDLEHRQVVTDWTRKAPAFVLPKIKYRMLTVVEQRTPERVVYRHQLLEGNLVHSSDALVVLESLGPKGTRVSIINFFNPVVGPFRALAEGKLWRKSLENAFKDDIAFRARAEHPEWDLERISEESRKAVARHPVDEIEYTDLIRFR